MRSLMAAALLLPVLAYGQVPQKLGYQGRLLKADGTPQTGVVSLTFAIFASETATSSLWSEDQALGLSDGFYSTFLGEVKPFPPKLFDGSERYLEVSSGGKGLSPRQRIASVAYALMATDARNVVGGTVNATNISVNGTTIIDNSGKLVGPAASAAAAHTHPAADVVSGTLALARIPMGSGSGLDADKLDGLDSAVLAQKADLFAPGTQNAPGNPVDWTKLKGIPGGFADGTDDGLNAVAHDGSLSGSGAPASPLAVNVGTTAGTVASGDHSHPAATATAAGLMSASDKARLDALSVLPAGVILPYGGGGAPEGFLQCDGSVVSQTVHAALFAAIGTTYNTGGEPAGTFRLPDLRSRFPIGEGQGPGYSQRTRGGRGGNETHTLTVNEMPSHSHTYNTQALSLWLAGGATLYGPEYAGGGRSTSAAGGSAPHPLMNPFLVVNYIIKR